MQLCKIKMQKPEFAQFLLPPPLLSFNTADFKCIVSLTLSRKPVRISVSSTIRQILPRLPLRLTGPAGKVFIPPTRFSQLNSTKTREEQKSRAPTHHLTRFPCVQFHSRLVFRSIVCSERQTQRSIQLI